MVVVLTKEGNAGGIANLKVKIMSFFLDMLNLSGLWDIPVKGSCVENGNLGRILRKLCWSGVLEVLAHRRSSKSRNG